MNPDTTCSLTVNLNGQDQVLPVLPHHFQPLPGISQGIRIGKSIPQVSGHLRIIGMFYQDWASSGCQGRIR